MTATGKDESGRATALILHSGAELRPADRTLLRMVASLDAERWRPVVAVPRKGPLVTALEALGVRVEVGPLGVVRPDVGVAGWFKVAVGALRALLFVRGLIGRHAPVLVHTHTGAVVGGAVAASLLARGRHVWHLHGAPPESGLRAWWAIQGLTRLADVIVCSSLATREAVVSLAPAVHDRTRIVRGVTRGVRAATDHAVKGVRERFGLLDDGQLVLAVAGAGAEGVRDLLDAAVKVRVPHPDMRFALVHDEGAQDASSAARALDAAIAERGLEGVVTRVRAGAELTVYFSSADIVCAPDHDVATSHVVALEAMAAERPVIASSAPGLDEYVRPGATGLTFAPGDSDRLAWSLGALGSEASRRRSMGAAAAELREAEFPVARMRNEMDRIWATAIGRDYVLHANRVRVVHVAPQSGCRPTMESMSRAALAMADAQRASGLVAELWGLAEAPAPPTRIGDRAYAVDPFDDDLPEDLARAIGELDTSALVHLHGGGLPLFQTIAERLVRRGVPYVLTPHGAYMRGAGVLEGPRDRMREAGILKNARAVHALSEQEQKAIARIAPKVPSAVVPHGQSMGSAPPTPVDARGEGRPAVCVAGPLLLRSAGLEDVLRGFARHIAKKGSGVLWFVGDGPDGEAIEALATELGVQRRVRVVANAEGATVHEWIEAADAYLCASPAGGMPLEALEAAALGRPLLVSPASHLDRDVVSTGAGFKVGGGPKGVAAALAKLEADAGSGELALKGKRAALMAAEWFAWPVVVEQHALDLYRLAGFGTDEGPRYRASA